MKRYKLYKQRNNKKKIINIKGGLLEKVCLVEGGLLKSQQNEQGVDSDTHTNVCESIYPPWIIYHIMKILDSCYLHT